MKKKLNSFRQYVIRHIQATADTDQQNLMQGNPAAQLLQLKESLLLEIEALVLSKRNDHLIKRHIRYTQIECIHLLDLLPDENSDHFVNPLQKLTRSCLEQVLDYLFDAHSYHVDQDVYAPEQHLLRRQKQIADQLNVLKAGLKRKKVIPELQYIIAAAFERFVHLTKATYHQLHYHSKLQQSIIKLCNQINNVQFDELLLEHLIYFSFNESAFVSFCKQQMIQDLDQMYQETLKYEKLCFFEKSLMAQQEKINFRFSSERPSVKSQLMAFVSAELNYYKRNYDFVAQKQTVNNFTQTGVTPYRVKMNLSVDGLAYLVRLFCQSEVIEANPRSKLLEFISQHFQTAGIGDKLLSAQSLGTKYKQVTQSTANGLRVLLNRMIKEIDADFGKT